MGGWHTHSVLGECWHVCDFIVLLGFRVPCRLKNGCHAFDGFAATLHRFRGTRIQMRWLDAYFYSHRNVISDAIDVVANVDEVSNGIIKLIGPRHVGGARCVYVRATCRCFRFEILLESKGMPHAVMCVKLTATILATLFLHRLILVVALLLHLTRMTDEHVRHNAPTVDNVLKTIST